MSATMSRSFERPRLICGVCAEIAARAALPVWMPRAAFVIGGLTHAIPAIIVYLVLARTMCVRRLPVSGASTRPDMGPDVGAVRDRFGTLDRRLSYLEAAALRRETALRRAFRDLERG